MFTVHDHKCVEPAGAKQASNDIISISTIAARWPGAVSIFYNNTIEFNYYSDFNILAAERATCVRSYFFHNNMHYSINFRF